jgi:hypothetical protein
VQAQAPVNSTPANHWWSPAPPPDLPEVSARRAYTEVLFAFAVFFLTGVIAAGELLAGRYKDVLADASWATYVPQAVAALLQASVAVVLVLLLGARRGVTWRTLGLPLPRRADGRLAAGVSLRIFAWAIVAEVVGGVVNAALQTGHLPTTKPSGPELLFAMSDSLQAGVVEEFVVLAFVVVALRQARRPLWEVVIVALVLRGSYHIYYGPGVVGILVWAALFLWIYLRTRALLPLVVAHCVWDAVGFLSQRWGAVAGFAVLVGVAILIAAPITWAVERGQGGHSRQPPVPPGWHPDPSGDHYWRWWDGYRWTGHVSGP